jgi:hypothetical protein
MSMHVSKEQIESMASEANVNPSAFGIEPSSDFSFSPPGNVIRGRAELWLWHSTPPSSYFLYVNESLGLATTWMGDVLGNVRFGKEYRDNLGGVRIPIVVYGTNRIRYHGTYFKSAGDYARIKAYRS